jgi:hypothetical protein
MIGRGEVTAALYGSWLLARRQPAGMAFFDASVGGFWRSFWAWAVIAPVSLGLDTLGGLFAGPQGVALPLLVQAIGMVIDAMAFPLAMAGISQQLGRGERYISFIVAFNWSEVLRTLVFLAATIVVHVVPGAAMLLPAVLVLLLVYQAYIAHVALAVSPATAGTIILLNLLIDAVIALSARHLIAGLPVST